MQQEELSNVYYVVIDEQSHGPYKLDEVMNLPSLQPHTLVWKPGLDNWVAASTLPEFSQFFIPKNDSGYPGPPPYQQTSYPNDPYRHPSYQDNQPYSQGPHYHPHQPWNRSGYNPRQGYGPQSYHTNWLPWAIVAAVVGFFTSCIGAIFGIIGIVQANKANTMYAQGLDREADSANANAKTMTIIGLILAGLGVLVMITIGNIFPWY